MIPVWTLVMVPIVALVAYLFGFKLGVAAERRERSLRQQERKAVAMAMMAPVMRQAASPYQQAGVLSPRDYVSNTSTGKTT